MRLCGNRRKAFIVLREISLALEHPEGLKGLLLEPSSRCVGVVSGR